MAYVEIPIRADLPAYEYTIELEQVQYTLGFNWNARIAKWFMDIMDKDGNPLVMGIKMLSGFPLKYKFVDAAVPPGEFFLLDTANQNQDPKQDDFGSRVVLLYRESTTVD